MPVEKVGLFLEGLRRRLEELEPAVLQALGTADAIDDALREQLKSAFQAVKLTLGGAPRNDS